MPRRKSHLPRVAGAALLVIAACGHAPARAQDANGGESARSPFPEGPLRRLNDALKPYGLSPSLTYIGDLMDNPTGGVRRGAVYGGRLDLGLEADLSKFGWSGAKFHVNATNNHGDWMSREHLGNLMTASNIEGLNHTRLEELWIEQSFGKSFALRVGQFGADTEFAVSKYANLLNSGFSWNPVWGDLPSGGPAAPLTALGLRARATLSDRLSVLFAVFNGDPAGPGLEDPQDRNPHGVNFRLRDPPLLIGELQYSYRLDAARPGSVKLGAWMHTGEFADLRYDTNGLPLADPASNGVPATHRGDFAPYLVVDQMLVPFDDKGGKGIGAFAHLYATRSDRNLVDFHVDGGINVSGFSAKRPDDSISVGAAYARISPAARGFDQDSVRFGTPTAIRDYEALLAAGYSASLGSGWTLQPEIQYVMHPGGGAGDPNSPGGQRIANALIFGLRLSVQWGERDPYSMQ